MERLPGDRRQFSWRVPSEGMQSAMTLCPTLDRGSGRTVGFAGSARSDPRAWNGRPDGAGEAAMPQRPCRGCHGARGSTLTSWRSGRMGGVSETTAWVIASGAEDGASGWCWRGADSFGSGAEAPGSIRLAHSNKPERNAWPSHAAAEDSFGATLLRGVRLRAEPRARRFDACVQDAHAQATETLVESLILAQDQRWRRA